MVNLIENNLELNNLYNRIKKIKKNIFFKIIYISIFLFKFYPLVELLSFISTFVWIGVFFKE
jgi:hypothetical protein